MAAELVTSDDLDAYLSGDPNAALEAAEAAVRAYCGWHVAPVKAETVKVDATAGIALVPSLRVVSVDSVTVNGVTASGYQWREHGVIRDLRGYCDGEVLVSMTHGFDVDSPVAEVLRSTILAVAARAQVSPTGVVRAQVGQISETYSQTGSNQAGGVSLLDGEKAALDAYRLPPRP